MDELIDGGPAYPVGRLSGMTLRDYFASVALPALMAQHPTAIDIELARRAYELADAMRRARDGS